MALTEQEEFELLSLERERTKLPPEIQSKWSGIGIGDVLKAVPSIVASDIKAEVPKTLGTISAIGQLPYTLGKQVYETGRGVFQPQFGQRLMAGEKQAIKETIEPFTHPKKYLQEKGALASFLNWYPAAVGLKTFGVATTKLGGRVALKSLSSAYGVPGQYVMERLLRSKEIQAAPTVEQMATKLPEVAGKLNSLISQLDELGNQTLSKIPKIDIRRNVNYVMKQTKIGLGKPVTSVDVKLLRELDIIDSNIGEYGSIMSESELKNIITKIDNSIDWGMEGATTYNNTLQSIRFKFDNLLKSKNPQYAKVMKPESELINLNKDLHKNFGLIKKVGEPMPEPSNTTQIKILTAASPKSMLTKKTLDRISQYIGEDLTQQIKDVNAKHQFEIARPQGSKRTNIGIGIGGGVGSGLGYALGGTRGAVTGGSIGTTLGTLAGMTMDTGGPALAKIIDKWASLRK